MLAAAGADTATVDPLTRFVGACLAPDRAVVDALLAAEPELLDGARQGRPDLVARAARLGRPEAVRLAAGLSFDVNARHRTTALHEAALRGDLATVATLIELGANPAIVDTEFGGTARGWAEHGGQAAVVAYLDGLAGPA